MILGLQLHHDQTKFIQSLLKNKLLTIRAAENVIRILPPLNVNKNEINIALKIINKEGVKRKQVGVTIDCEPLKGPNTTFWPIKNNGFDVGKVTSAVYSPRLKKNIALAMVLIDHSQIGNNLNIETSFGIFSAEIVNKPFFDPNKKIAQA